MHVVVAFTTLLGVDDLPGELSGYGPIPADLAREITADAVWRRLLIDPESGALLDHGRTTYRPPDALADHVRARDQQCRMPICRRRVDARELDHTTAWDDGGMTATTTSTAAASTTTTSNTTPAGPSPNTPTDGWNGPPRPGTATSATRTTTDPTRPAPTRRRSGESDIRSGVGRVHEAVDIDRPVELSPDRPDPG